MSPRPYTAAHPLPRRVDVYVDEHRDGALAKRLAHRRRGDGAAAEAQDGRRLGPELANRDLFLATPERRFAVLPEEGRRVVRHRRVDIHEAAADARSDLRAKRSLARAHEPDERQMVI